MNIPCHSCGKELERVRISRGRPICEGCKANKDRARRLRREKLEPLIEWFEKSQKSMGRELPRIYG